MARCWAAGSTWLPKLSHVGSRLQGTRMLLMRQMAHTCWPALWPALHAAACRDAQAAPSLPLHVQVAAPAAPLDADQHRDVAEEVWTGMADLLPAHLLALLTVPELRDTFLVAGFKSSLVSFLHALD